MRPLATAVCSRYHIRRAGVRPFIAVRQPSHRLEAGHRGQKQALATDEQGPRALPRAIAEADTVIGWQPMAFRRPGKGGQAGHVIAGAIRQAKGVHFPLAKGGILRQRHCADIEAILRIAAFAVLFNVKVEDEVLNRFEADEIERHALYAAEIISNMYGDGDPHRAVAGIDDRRLKADRNKGGRGDIFLSVSNAGKQKHEYGDGDGA
jgi:hypothetical protein